MGDDAAPTPSPSPANAGMTLGQKVRVGVAVVVMLLLLIFVASNWEPVPVEFLGAAPQLPLAVWLFGAVSGGFVMGWTMNALRSRKSD